MLKERLEKEEQRRLWKLELEQLNKKIEEQDAKLKVLGDANEVLGKAVDEKQKSVLEQRQIKQVETEKNYTYSKNHAALTAKLSFIEANYDYSTQPKNLRLEDFRELMNSNNGVNEAVSQFQVHLQKCQKEI